jgi:hypothetical protein
MISIKDRYLQTPYPELCKCNITPEKIPSTTDLLKFSLSLSLKLAPTLPYHYLIVHASLTHTLDTYPIINISHSSLHRILALRAFPNTTTPIQCHFTPYENPGLCLYSITVKAQVNFITEQRDLILLYEHQQDPNTANHRLLLISLLHDDLRLKHIEQFYSLHPDLQPLQPFLQPS